MTARLRLGLRLRLRLRLRLGPWVVRVRLGVSDYVPRYPSDWRASGAELSIAPGSGSGSGSG